MVVQANVTLVGADTKFVDDGHVSRDGEIVLHSGVEGGRCGRRDETTGIIAVGVCREGRGGGGGGVTGVGRLGRGREAI